MARQKYFIGSLGPYFYHDDHLLPDGSGNFQGAVDGNHGRIGTLLSDDITVSGTLEATTLTDGTFTVTGGVISAGTWQGSIIAATYGGTGLADPTDHSLLVGSGAAALTELGVATNGQIPIGSTGADPVLAAILGTANEIEITNGAGTIQVGIVTSPTLDGANITGVPAASILAGTFGTGSYVMDTDLNVQNDLDVDNDLNVDGDGTFGGTSLSLANSATSQFFVNRTGAGNANIALNAGGSLSHLIFDDANNFTIAQQPKADVGSVSNLTRLVTIDTSGNFGIGAAIPATKLQVVGTTRFGDQATNYATFAADGELTLVGTARVEKHIKLDAAVATVGGTAPSISTSGNFKVLVYSSSGPTESAFLTFQVPEDWDESTSMFIHVHWAPATTNGGNVKWDIEYTAVASNAEETLTAGSVNVTTTDVVINAPAAQELHESPDAEMLAANLALEDTIGLELTRDTGVGGNLSGGASFVFLEITYTANKLGLAT